MHPLAYIDRDMRQVIRPHPTHHHQSTTVQKDAHQWRPKLAFASRGQPCCRWQNSLDAPLSALALRSGAGTANSVLSDAMSFSRCGEAGGGPPPQRSAVEGSSEEVEYETHTPHGDRTLLLRACGLPPQGPQERVQRHTMEQMAEICSHGSDPRCSCGADGGTAGGYPEAHGHAGTCRAGYRRVPPSPRVPMRQPRLREFLDWPGVPLVARGSTSLDHVGPTGGCRARATSSGAHRRGSPPAQGGLQILGTPVDC